MPSPAGRQDPDSEFEASWRESEAGMLQLHAEANYLRAEALLPLLGLMPQKDIRERLQDLAPTGEWSDMRLNLARASVSDAWRFDARAKFRDMGSAPVGRAPGLRGLSGALAGTEAAGHVFIGTKSAVYNWPDQFPEPIALPALNRRSTGDAARRSCSWRPRISSCAPTRRACMRSSHGRNPPTEARPC